MGGLKKFILVAIIVTFAKVGAMPIGDVGEGINMEVQLSLVQFPQFSRRETAVRIFFHKK